MTLAQKSPKLTSQPGYTRTAAKQPALYPSSKPLLEAPCNLVPPDSLVSWRNGVATWNQDAKIGKFANLGWPARVGICGDLVWLTLDSQALIFPLVPCIGVWLPVTLAACCSPRGWSRDRVENSKKGKIWQPRTVSCITQANLEEQIRSSRAIDPWSCAMRIATPSWLGPLRHGDMGVMASTNVTKVAISTWCSSQYLPHVNP